MSERVLGWDDAWEIAKRVGVRAKLDAYVLRDGRIILDLGDGSVIIVGGEKDG